MKKLPQENKMNEILRQETK